jgi:hypothetical protein
MEDVTHGDIMSPVSAQPQPTYGQLSCLGTSVKMLICVANLPVSDRNERAE